MSDHVRTLLRCIYWAYIARRLERNPRVEAWLEISDLGSLVINESSHDDASEFAALFTPAAHEQLLLAFHEARRRLSEKPFQVGMPEIAVLDFIQCVAARAMWQHRIDVGQELEIFAREFDRLDDPVDQERLHYECQVDLARTLN